MASSLNNEELHGIAKTACKAAGLYMLFFAIVEEKCKGEYLFAVFLVIV